MDSLFDDLMKEALETELRNRRGKGSVNRLEEIRRVCHETYTNPENWRETKVIQLWHRETSSYLGSFQELEHKRVRARKLVRITAPEPLGLPDDTVVEFVEGPEWLGGPFVHQVDPPTEADIAAIRNFWRPFYWRPAWKHLKGLGRKRGAPTKSGEELLSELFQ